MANVVDSFNRANAASLGTADSGQTWSNFGGAGFSITTNQATVSAASAGTGTVIDSAASDSTVQVTMPSAATVSGGIVFRWVDASNFNVVQMVSAQLWLRKYVAGVLSEIAQSANLTFANNDIIAVVTSGASLTVKQNGVVRVTASDATNSTGTRGGLLALAGGIYDDFSITNAAAAGGTVFALRRRGRR